MTPATTTRSFTVWLLVKRQNTITGRWYLAGWSTKDTIDADSADKAVELALAAWQAKRPDRRFELIDVREEQQA